MSAFGLTDVIVSVGSSFAGPALSLAVRSVTGMTRGIALNPVKVSLAATGPSFVGATLTVTVPTEVRLPSLNVYVNVSTPKKLAAGV